MMIRRKLKKHLINRNKPNDIIIHQNTKKIKKTQSNLLNQSTHCERMLQNVTEMNINFPFITS